MPVTWPVFEIRSFPQGSWLAELHGEPWDQILKGGTLRAMVELLKRASTLQRQGPRYNNQFHALGRTNLTYKSEEPPQPIPEESRPNSTDPSHVGPVSRYQQRYAHVGEHTHKSQPSSMTPFPLKSSPTLTCAPFCLLGVPIATNHLQIKIVAVKVIKCMVSGKKRGRKEREVTRERRKRRVGAISWKKRMQLV